MLVWSGVESLARVQSQAVSVARGGVPGSQLLANGVRARWCTRPQATRMTRHAHDET